LAAFTPIFTQKNRDFSSVSSVVVAPSFVHGTQKHLWLYTELTSMYSKSKIESEIIRIWNVCLVGSEVDSQANLIDLGANSLTAMKASLMVKKQFKVTFTLKSIFDNPTITSQVDTIYELIANGGCQ
jgi:acyl carrier protein